MNTKCLVVACIIALVFFPLSTRAQDSTCFVYSKNWQKLRDSRKNDFLEKVAWETLSEPCFLALLENEQEKVRPYFNAFTQNRTDVSLHFLTELRRLAPPEKNTALWHTLFSVWEKKHSEPQLLIRALLEKGRYATADSVLLIYNQAKKLDPHDYLQWAKIKAILGDFNSAAHIFCTAGKIRRRLGLIARSQLVQLLGEEEKTTAIQALGTFTNCMLKSTTADTAQLRDWLFRAYDRLDAGTEQLALLLSLETANAPIEPFLVLLLKRQFFKNNHEVVIAAAKEILKRNPSPQNYAFANNALFNAYMELGYRDSSLQWLEKSQAAITNPDIIALYQDGGFLEKSDTLIKNCFNPVSRDTLSIRQFLMSQQLQKARSVLYEIEKKPTWTGLKKEYDLWRGRTALFTGDFAVFKTILDSLNYSPQWEYAPELLSWQLSYETLKQSPLLLEAWSKTAYYSFCNNVEKSGQPLEQLPDLTTRPAQFLLFSVIHDLLKNGYIAQAKRLLNRLDPQTSSPEQTFLTGEILLHEGAIEEAMGLFKNLILSHPNSIYASQARLLLISDK